MGFTKWELVQFFDGLMELVSEENREKPEYRYGNSCLTLKRVTNMKMQ